MTRKPQRSVALELPNNLEIVVTRDFDAPIGVVFDAFTTRDRAEMARAEGEALTVCTIDLRVGGNYHQVFVGGDGSEASFHGTFLAVERPMANVDNVADLLSSRLGSAGSGER
jgi:uncharacterized protein YndB with AHSA1/START domain